ncbi:MAG: lysylphosphatidylglycerol synthase transmembrane domain-containing protein [Myxococcota bacterium]
MIRELKAHGVRLAAALLAIGAVGIAFRDADFSRAYELLAQLGLAGIGLALLPQLLGVLLELSSWQRALDSIGYKTSFPALFRVRVASESLSLCLPGGALLAESLKVPLFARHSGFAAARALVAIALRKYLLLAAQGMYFLLAAVASALSGSGGLRSALPLAAASTLLSAMAFGSRALFAGGRSAATCARWLSRLPIAALRTRITHAAAGIAAGDRDVAHFFTRGVANEAHSVLLALASWCCEALETFVLLSLLGARLDFADVAAMEVALSLLRNLLVFLPAGIGVQDAGYAFFLNALGLPAANEMAVAFALLKRSKELAWLTLGLALLGQSRRAKGPQPTASVAQ